MVCSSTQPKHAAQNRRVDECGFFGWGTSWQSWPLAMLSPHLLHGVARPQVCLRGRPRDEPISDGVFPLAILRPLELSNEVVEDAWECFCRRDELLEGPLGPLATIADLLRDGLVHHHEGGDGVVERSDLRL